MAKNFQIVNMLSDDSTEVLHPETNADNILDGSLKNIPTKVQTADWDAKSQEVIAARKGKTTLKDKVDEIDTNIVNIDSEMSQLDSRYPSKAEFDAIKDQIAQNKPVVITDDMPVGAIVFRDRVSQLQDGWLKCDGSDLLVSEYQELFNVIGYTHGGSGGSFKLPDLRIQNLVVEGIDDAETTIDGKIVKNQMGIIKAKKLGEDTVTAAREWSDFKANGGEIGGDMILEGNVTFRGGEKSIIYAPSDGWFGIQASNATTPPSTLFYDPRTEHANSLYSNKVGGINLGYKDIAPFKDIWVGGYSARSVGFTKLPNGMIMQWGEIGGGFNNGVFQQTINFPIAFPNSTFVTFTNCMAIGGGNIWDIICNIHNPRNNYNVEISAQHKSIQGNWSCIFEWVAIGY